MKRAFMGLLFVVLLFVPTAAQDRQMVLLAAHRAGRVEILDPTTLAPIGSIRVLPLADGVSNSPDGTTLYIPEGIAPNFETCCALYALDLQTEKMTRVVMPASGATISPDGSYVITQRGAVGIEVYGDHGYARESHISSAIAPGAYQLSFSPDGELLFGLTQWKGPTLDIFDFASRNLIRRYPVDGNWTLRGEWVDGRFYLYARRGPDGQIWKVDVESPRLGAPVTMNFPDVDSRCEIHDENVLAAGSRFLVYEVFGNKGDRRLACRTSIPGGVLSVDPESGRILSHLTETVHFNSIVASTDGQELYGIDVRDLSWSEVELVRMDAMSGRILAERDLTPDVWFIDLAALPQKLVPRGEVSASVD
jgi:hypothetical protein